MKRVARLTSSLLARKGYAAPAQGTMADAMGYAVVYDRDAIRHEIPERPDPAPAREEQPSARLPGSADALANSKTFGRRTGSTLRCSHNNGTGRCPDTGTSAHGKRVAMTLRLDHARHLKLRVLSALACKSSQEILTIALDEYLERHLDEPELRNCECLHAGNAH